MPDGEPVEIVDEAGAVVGLTTRAAMRAGNLRHRSVAVVVVTGAGALVAHRRAGWKDVWPGRWDLCFGGVAAVGEGWEDAARRELAEEAGVAAAPADLALLGSGTYADQAVSAVYRIYALTHDGPFTPADGEVAELVLVPLPDLEAWLAGRDLCDDARALVLPHVRHMARGHSPRPPGDARG